MTQQATSAKLQLSKPNQHGRVIVRPEGADYEVCLHPFISSGDGDDTPRFLSVESELATDRDATLREMEAREENLGDQRWSTRGVYADVDKLYDDMNSRRFEVWLEIAREALTTVASVFDRDPAESLDGARGDAYAGCRTCKCSPGVTLSHTLVRDGQLVNAYIRRLRPTPKHRLPVAQIAALRYASSGSLICDEQRYPHRYFVNGQPDVKIRPTTVDALWRLDLLRTGDRTGDHRPLHTNEHGTFELYARS
jgi:hypothetical protein